MTIEGMMCPHCEKRVRKALEALPQVDSAEPSFESGTCVVTLNAKVADEVLKAAVEEEDYPVLKIE
jgi:Cu2+-exporting ATPase